MPGIFPNQGPIFREQDGTCQTTMADNTYCPDPNFVVSCPLRALPSDCTARLDPEQINAIVSELLAFAEALCPNGEWDCASVTNLADTWNEGCWLTQICTAATEVDYNPNISFLGCLAGELVKFSPPSLDPCDNAPAIADCVRSADGANELVFGSDDLLYIPKHGFYSDEQGQSAQIIPLDTVGSTTLPQTCTTIDNPSTLPMRGIMRFTVLGNAFRRIGSGNLSISTELSKDGGETWTALAENQWQRDVPDDFSTIDTALDNRATQIVVPPLSSGTFCARTTVKVITAYGTGSQINLSTEVEVIAGTEFAP